MRFGILYMMQTNVVVAEGEITQDTPRKFQQFLDSKPFDGTYYVVSLNSPGGNVHGGIELGRLIRENRLHTTVLKFRRHPKTDELIHESEAPGECYSACALAYLGGIERKLNPESKLGFHQFSSAKGSFETQESVLVSEAQSQILGAEILNYIEGMGVKSTLYANLSKTLPFDLYLPDPIQLRSLNITTQKSFQNFEIKPYGKGVVANAIFRGNAVGRNNVDMITTLCKRGVPYIVLSWSEWSPSDGNVWKDLAKNQKGFRISPEIYARTIAYGPDVVAVMSRGKAIAEIRLDNIGAKLLSKKSSGSIDIPAMYGIYSFSIDPKLTDVESIEASFRLCVE